VKHLSFDRPAILIASAIAAIGLIAFAGAASSPGSSEFGEGDTIQTEQVAVSPQLVPPAGSLVVIRGNDYRVVDLDNGGNLYLGDDESAAVAAADAALASGTRIAYDTIQRTVVDPTP
jgi:hypothetical protein